VRKAATLFALLLAAWLLWSGGYSIPRSQEFHGLLLTLGVVACAGVLAVVFRMGRQDGDDTSYWSAVGLVRFVPWLLWQIVLSNLHVARVIVSPRLPIRPRLVHLPAPLRSDFARTVLANAITLTPGTLTLDVREGGMQVHALTDDSARGLLSSSMVERVARLDGPDDAPTPPKGAEGPTG